MKKILSIFGTRPEAIKMAPVIYEISSRKNLKSIIAVTAQHREMLDQVMQIFNIKSDYDLNIMTEKQTLTDITVKSLRGLEKIITHENPDLILVHGDTTTTFAAALAGYYHKIPVGHVEAGLRTGEFYSPFPEEINRVLADHLSSLHFAPTESAKNNLIKCGIRGDSVEITGNSVIDALYMIIEKNIPFENPLLKNIDFSNKRLILVTAHRRENFGVPLQNIITALETIHNDFKNVLLVYPVHLNPNVRIPVYKRLNNLERIMLLPPVSYTDLVNLIEKSYIVITDSGGLQEEAPALGKPVVVLREVTERPEAIEAGTAILAGTQTGKIVEIVSDLLTNKSAYDKMANAVNPYGDGTARFKIVDKIEKFLKI